MNIEDDADILVGYVATALENKAWDKARAKIVEYLHKYNNQYFNNLSPAELERLAILTEEMGEAQQAVGKILRHGYSSDNNGKNALTNREDLEKECGDVRHAMIRLCDADDLSKKAIHACADTKAILIEQYLHHQD